MEDPRGQLPVQPDDSVAARLLDAATDAMERGRCHKGLDVLRQVVRDFRGSQVAACVRTVTNRLSDQSQGRRR